MNIYIFKNEQQFGPYTVEQLREYVQQGHFTLEDYACGDGQNWIPLSQIPGFAIQAQPGQHQQSTQPAQAQAPKAGTQVPQAQIPAATKGASKKKKIILFSSIGGACLAAIIAGFVIWLGGDDDEKSEQLADEGGQKSANNEAKQGVDDQDGGSGTNNEEKDIEPAIMKATSLGDVPLLDRITSNSLAVGLIDYGAILEKGGQEIRSLLPPNVPPQLSTVLKDPSTVGLDSSVPMQVVFSAYDAPGEDGLLGIAGKLEDAAKFKTVLGLLPGFENPEEKDGYELYVVPDSSLVCLGIAKDFFVIWGLDGGPGSMDDLILEMDKFIHSDGSDSLVNSNESFQAFMKDSHDAAIWVNGESLTQLPDASDEIPEEFSDLIKGGSGLITLDFENGEAVLAGELQVPEGFERFGKGGLSEGAVNLIPAKALAVLSLSLDMKTVVDYLENTIFPVAKQEGAEVDLDQVIPEFGIKPRDVLETFTGEISVALTEFSTGGGGPVPGEDLPGEPEQNPFGGGGDAQPPAEVDPFGGSPEPAPGQGFPGGVPGGPPSGGLGMGGGLPVEFIAALSVDPVKWETLKAAPPLAGAMAGAMLMGISVTVKDERLVLASKKHIAEAMEGSVQDKLAGSEQSLFNDNDFALKLDIVEAAKLEDLPLPPPVMANLNAFSYIAITGKSDEKGGGGALRIGFSDKGTNSLKSLLGNAPELIKMLGAGANPAVENGGEVLSKYGLHDAAEEGNLKGIADEISFGADIDSQMGEDGETPLHRASTRGQLEATKFLIRKGANVNIGREKDGKTALDLAESRGHEEIAEFLKNNGGENSR